MAQSLRRQQNRLNKRLNSIEELRRRLAEEEEKMREDQKRVVRSTSEKVLKIVQTELSDQLSKHIGNIDEIVVDRQMISDLVAQMLERTLKLTEENSDGEAEQAEDVATKETEGETDDHADDSLVEEHDENQGGDGGAHDEDGGETEDEQGGGFFNRRGR